ncbi:MAG: PulJ/GspJ family protein [Opitutales bacterium]
MNTTPSQPTRRRRRHGFTLVETLVSTGVVGIVSGAMLATVVFLSKTGYNISNHMDMASEARLALEYISRDLLSAVDVTTSNGRRMTITVELPDESTYDVDYHTRLLNGEYYLRRRVFSGGSWSSWETILAADLIKDVKFFYYDSKDVQVNKKKMDDIKKINVRLEMETSFSTGFGDITQSDTIYSARFVLRNRATPSSG